MASFVLSFFPLDILDEIWDLIGSVSEEFLTYSYTNEHAIMTLPVATPIYVETFQIFSRASGLIAIKLVCGIEMQARYSVLKL